MRSFPVMAICIKEEDFIMDWNHKVREVVEKYQPDVIWLDGGQFQDSINEKMVTDLLGSDEKIVWKRSEKGLEIKTPSHIPSEYTLTFRIKVKGKLSL